MKQTLLPVLALALGWIACRPPVTGPPTPPPVASPASGMAQVKPQDWLPKPKAGWKVQTFTSAAIGAEVGYYIFLPPSYDQSPARRYPVVYWLHGATVGPNQAGQVRDRLERAQRAGTAPEMILVACTDATRHGFWLDHESGPRLETMVVREVVPHVDAHFRTVATREARAIEGYSMGGFGAAYLGFKYPELFGTVSILAGALFSPDALNEPDPNRRARIEQVFAGAPGGWTAHSPWKLVDQNLARIRGRTFVRIFVGGVDRLRPMNEAFHRHLQSRGIDHEFGIVEGSDHGTRDFYGKWRDDIFAFYARAFAAPTPSCTSCTARNSAP